ncbi:hypothetical protein SAZ11_39970 [Streptomyces sp. FXJ1.4098]|nr:hypothetical protein [Streptomyces sp. FXJ1.4098]
MLGVVGCIAASLSCAGARLSDISDTDRDFERDGKISVPHASTPRAARKCPSRLSEARERRGFWRTDDHSIDVYEDARRLLVVGPDEALYMIFNGDSGS